MMDEFAAAYTGGANSDYRMLATDNAVITSGAHDLNLGGAFNFMVHLETYLKAARLNYPATYNAIRKNAQTVAAIQTVWNGRR